MDIFFETILDLIYPQVCGICGKEDTKSLCNKCRIKLNNKFEFITNDYSKDTYKNFSEHYYLFKYENEIRSLILDLKFHEKPYIYKVFSYFFKIHAKYFEKLEKYDIMLIVPISKKRAKERGYNQSKLIAREISKLANAKIVNNVLYKTKNTVPQSSLNKKQREENARGVYKVKNCRRIYNKRILLIDDIYTTGSTVNECAKVLVQNGVNKKYIGVLTLAKD